jgi:hypothetical protein
MDILHGLRPILGIDRRRIIRSLVGGLEVTQFPKSPDRVERHVGDIRVPADAILMAQVKRQELEMVLSSQVDWRTRVVDGRVAWVWAGNRSARSANDFAKTLDFIVSKSLISSRESSPCSSTMTWAAAGVSPMRWSIVRIALRAAMVGFGAEAD